MTSAGTSGGFGLVLGAGGTVGLAYHAGVLRALEEVGGLVPNDASLIVGTSAGAVAGAYVRSGWSTDDLWQLALGTHPSLDGLSPDELAARQRAIMEPVWHDPVGLLRRGIGSAYVAGRSFVRVPPIVHRSVLSASAVGPAMADALADGSWVPGPLRAALRFGTGAALPPELLARLRRAPGVLERLFPAGMFAMAEGRRRFTEELPAEWPERPLWLCAYDIDRGHRVVLGRPHGRGASSPPASTGPPHAAPSRPTLVDAVAASCAIPGVYPPVRTGSMTLVDGGVWSTTNLDLAAEAGCGLIVGVAPLAFDTVRPLPAPLLQLVRRVPARMLVGEMALARKRGAEVLLLRPSARELRLHGANLMRRSGLDEVARAAYDATAATLGTDRFRAVIASAAAA
jgi:NTE family protein